jgi:hypothetical protein
MLRYRNINVCIGSQTLQRVEGLYYAFRVPAGCLSLRPNWLPPPPLPLASVSPRRKQGGGCNTRLRVGGGVGANSDGWRESPGTLCTLCCAPTSLLGLIPYTYVHIYMGHSHHVTSQLPPHVSLLYCVCTV